MEVANEPRAGVEGAARGQEPAKDRPGARMASLGQGRPSTLEHTTARYIVPGSPVYNGNLALFPGMTADCAIVTQRREDVLRVPSSALRFNPAAFLSPAELTKVLALGSGKGTGHGQGMAAGRPGGSAAGPRPGGGAGGAGVASRGLVARAQERIWTLEQGKLKPLQVRASISDGMYTEISGDGFAPGLAVVTGVDDLKKAQNGGGGPLMGGMRH